jgi:hypothetical protein
VKVIPVSRMQESGIRAQPLIPLWGDGREPEEKS